MTKNEYILPQEVNKKPFETVYEIKNEVPSFEEFMKSYEGPVNYDDLNVGDSGIGESRRYGPCWSCGNYSIDFQVILEAEHGADSQWFFGIPLEWTPKRFIDWHNSSAKEFLESITISTFDMNGIWQDRYMRYKIQLDNTNEADELLRHFANGNLSVRGRGNRHHTGAENVVINTVRNALSRHRSGENVYINRDY